MELTTQKTYGDFKHALDTELTKTSESFVRIGYLLKLARDTDILAESGYDNVNDFAYAEYGMDKSQVSRFININNRFSEGGYSDCLQDEYKAYGYTKLAMMLTLPEAVVQELTPNYSKAEIQAVKEEVEAEEQISPIEVYLEGKDEVKEAMPTVLNKVLHQLFHDDVKLFCHLHHQIKYGGDDEDIMDALAPSGDSFYSVRIQGEGRKFLTTKENDEKVAITDARSGEKEIFTWKDIYSICRAIINTDIMDKDNWEQIYEEPYPEEKKEPVAPVQPIKEPTKEDKKKPAPKKPSKVTKAKTPKKPENAKADKGCDTSKNEPQKVGNVAINDTKTPIETETESIVEENEGKLAAVESPETRINTPCDRDLTADEKEAKEAYELTVRVEQLLRDWKTGLSLNTIQLAINYINELKGILLYLESRNKTEDDE